MDDPFAIDVKSEAAPLCCSYFGACFHLQKVQLSPGNNALDESSVIFALGLLRNGSWEVLGAWPMQAIEDEFWRGTFGDLMARGVSRITHMCAHRLSDADLVIPTATSANFAGFFLRPRLATVISSECDSFHDLRSPDQTLIRNGERILARLSRSLNQAVRRHGPFRGVADATSFVAASLAGAERRVHCSSTSASPFPTCAEVRAKAMRAGSWG